MKLLNLRAVPICVPRSMVAWIDFTARTVVPTDSWDRGAVAAEMALESASHRAQLAFKRRSAIFLMLDYSTSNRSETGLSHTIYLDLVCKPLNLR